MNPPPDKSEATDPSDREVVSIREFAASREAVFKAFSDPKQLALWWGPHGFTHTFREFDLRPGGSWHFVMHGPDGADYPNHNQFTEIIPNERIVFQHRQSGHDFQTTLSFAGQEGKARVTWGMRFASAAELAPLKNFIVQANEENLDRLAVHLARGKTPPD